MEEESYTSLPTSYLLGSVPAVTTIENSTSNSKAPEANLSTYPPSDGHRGYQTLGGSSEGDGQQATNNWNGVFSVSSYKQYFNVDTDVFIHRLMSSLHPLGGDFFDKIDVNPDLYGLVWISTTLVFVIASMGNFSTYLMHKRTDNNTPWSFDISYVNTAAYSVYGYVLIVPLVFNFLLQYLGSNTSLVRFWCMWGYSLSIFIISSFLLVIPVEFLRWLIIIVTGAASAGFVALNLRSYIQSNNLTVVLVATYVLQLGLSMFIKIRFFP